MQANMSARSVVIVLLDSVGKYTRIGDANRIRQWLDALEDTPRAGVIRAEAAPARLAARRQAGAAEGHISVQLQAATLR
jgi:D-alanyl-D-alanine endopeptidase (penicillin-binding protein 7)